MGCHMRVSQAPASPIYSNSCCLALQLKLLAVAAPPWRDPNVAVEARVKDLLGRMSVEEKIIQLDARQQPTGAVDRLGIRAFQGWNGEFLCRVVC